MREGCRRRPLSAPRGFEPVASGRGRCHTRASHLGELCLRPRRHSQRGRGGRQAGGPRSPRRPPQKRGSEREELRLVAEGAAGLPSLEQPGPCRPPSSRPDPGSPSGQAPGRPGQSEVAVPPQQLGRAGVPKQVEAGLAATRPGPQSRASLRSRREGSASESKHQVAGSPAGVPRRGRGRRSGQTAADPEVAEAPGSPNEDPTQAVRKRAGGGKGWSACQTRLLLNSHVAIC